jgi:hypothetical protein
VTTAITAGLACLKFYNDLFYAEDIDDNSAHSQRNVAIEAMLCMVGVTAVRLQVEQIQLVANIA